MQESILTLALERECLEPFEIHVGHALKTANFPDKTDTVWQGDLALRIHSKRVEPNQPLYLIAIEQEQHGERQLNMVLKVFPDLCDDLENKSPLEVLRNIASRFGVVVRIGRKQEKFFLSESVPAIGPGDVEILEEATERARRNRIPQIYCRMDEGPPQMANCALGFCLDVPKYKAWLQTHRRTWRR
ncbi:MAG: hypothetical protein JXM73_17485 [Anaerolineae bacterium]|nr:hypothetical protein [Anaerolineae bacterium]